MRGFHAILVKGIKYKSVQMGSLKLDTIHPMGKITFLTASLALLLTWGLYIWTPQDATPVVPIPEIKKSHSVKLEISKPIKTAGISPKKISPKTAPIETPVSGLNEPIEEMSPSDELRDLDSTETITGPNDDVQQRLMHELNRVQVLNSAWLDEKMKFYQEKLHLNEDQITELYRLDEVADEAIREYSQKISDNPTGLSEQEYQDTIRGYVATYEQDAHGILGEDGINQIKNFREEFNSKSYARFGTHVKQMGF